MCICGSSCPFLQILQMAPGKHVFAAAAAACGKKSVWCLEEGKQPVQNLGVSLEGGEEQHGQPTWYCRRTRLINVESAMTPWMVLFFHHYEHNHIVLSTLSTQNNSISYPPPKLKPPDPATDEALPRPNRLPKIYSYYFFVKQTKQQVNWSVNALLALITTFYPK